MSNQSPWFPPDESADCDGLFEVVSVWDDKWQSIQTTSLLDAYEWLDAMRIEGASVRLWRLL